MVHADVENSLRRLMSKKYRKYAVAVSRKWVQRSELFASNEIYCFNRAENIQNYSISLNIRKGFPYIGEVNEIIRNALEAGLILKWEHDGHLPKSHDDFISNPNFQLNDIILLAVGLFVVAFVIVAEIIAHNQMESLNHYNLLIFTHKIFRSNVHSLK